MEIIINQEQYDITKELLNVNKEKVVASIFALAYKIPIKTAKEIVKAIKEDSEELIIKGE